MACRRRRCGSSPRRQRPTTTATTTPKPSPPPPPAPPQTPSLSRAPAGRDRSWLRDRGEAPGTSGAVGGGPADQDASASGAKQKLDSSAFDSEAPAPAPPVVAPAPPVVAPAPQGPKGAASPSRPKLEIADDRSGSVPATPTTPAQTAPPKPAPDTASTADTASSSQPRARGRAPAREAGRGGGVARRLRRCPLARQPDPASSTPHTRASPSRASP